MASERSPLLVQWRSFEALFEFPLSTVTEISGKDENMTFFPFSPKKKKIIIIN